MIKYVLGFVVTPDLSKVLLIKKTSPVGMYFGMFNGIGGKLDKNEQISDGMIREFYEETGATITGFNYSGIMSRKDEFCIYTFCKICTEEEVKDNFTSPEGTTSWVKIKDLHDIELVNNAKWMIPLAIDLLQKDATFEVKYK